MLICCVLICFCFCTCPGLHPRSQKLLDHNDARPCIQFLWHLTREMDSLVNNFDCCGWEPGGRGTEETKEFKTCYLKIWLLGILESSRRGKVTLPFPFFSETNVTSPLFSPKVTGVLPYAQRERMPYGVEIRF